MKAGRFPVGSAKIEQIKADCGKKKIGCPRRNPWRDTVAFAECEKEVGEKVHGKNENHRSRDAG
jgi:hypothetical protein